MRSASTVPPVLPPLRALALPGEARVRIGAWSIPVSVALHVLVLAALLTFIDIRRPEALREEAINVEIVMLPPPAPAVPDTPEELAAKPRVPRRSHPRRKPTPIARPSMVKPSQMLSGAVLADPRSQEARDEIAQMPQQLRGEQLCGIEAMAQVGAWEETLKPDLVVSYAMAWPTMTGDVMEADGAAIHSGDEWFRLKYICELAPDRMTVVAFEFEMGDPIPRKDWEEHSLPDGSKPLD